MTASLFAVSFIDLNGVEQYSRICQSVRVARNWAKWIAKQNFATEARVWRGAPGGERVCTILNNSAA